MEEMNKIDVEGGTEVEKTQGPMISANSMRKCPQLWQNKTKAIPSVKSSGKLLN